MSVLQEVYFGKDALAPIQKQFSLVIRKFRNKPLPYSVNADKEIIKLNRMIEAFFGFTSFALYLNPSPMINAAAWPTGTGLTEEEKLKIYKSVVSSPTGFKFNPKEAKVSLIIEIQKGFLDSEMFSDEELIAVMLHEIGHGFFEAVTDVDKFSLMKKIASVFKSVLGFAKDKIIHGRFLHHDQVEEETRLLNPLVFSIKKGINEFNSNQEISEAMEDNMKKKRLAYTNEKFADTFAASYGYGVQLHSALSKIYKYYYDTMNKKTPSKFAEFFKVYDMYLSDAIAYAFNLQDEHPGDLARIKVSQDFVRHELAKTSLDPKMKNELVAQLNEMDKIIDDYVNYPRDEDSMRILRAYNTKLYNKYGGDRREQDTDNEALFTYIDNKFDSMK